MDFGGYKPTLFWYWQACTVPNLWFGQWQPHLALPVTTLKNVVLHSEKQNIWEGRAWQLNVQCAFQIATIPIVLMY